MVATVFTVSAFFVVLREVLEACLVVGIVLAYLNRSGTTHLRRYVWLGAGSAAVLAIACGLAFAILWYTKRREVFKGNAEHIFEGVVFLLAAIIMTWMLLWMMSLRQRIKLDMEETMESIVSRNNPQSSKFGIFSMVFIQVFREGIEAFIFMVGAASTASSERDAWRGIPLPGILALIVGIGASYAVFRGMVLLDIEVFFFTSSVILMTFSAGLIVHSVRELQEAQWFGRWNDANMTSRDWWNASMWDMSACCSPEGNEFFAFLRALFGYQDQPTFLEWCSYFLYWITIVIILIVAYWKVVRHARTRVAVVLKAFVCLGVLATFIGFVYACMNPNWNGVLVCTFAFILMVAASLATYDCFTGPKRLLPGKLRKPLALAVGVLIGVLTVFACSLHIAQMACDDGIRCKLPKFYYFGLVFNDAWAELGRSADGTTWVSIAVLAWSLIATLVIGSLISFCLILFSSNISTETGEYSYGAEPAKLGDEYQAVGEDSTESGLHGASLDSGRGSVHPMLS